MKFTNGYWLTRPGVEACTRVTSMRLASERTAKA